MKIRLKWPFDSATTLSIIAIVLTVIQLFLSAPLLTQFYLTPDLVVTGSGSTLDAQNLHGVFEVKNMGRAAANNVQIGLQLEEHQTISIIPNINAKIVQEEIKFFMKDVRIEIPKLMPKERIDILINSGPNGERFQPNVAKSLMTVGYTEIPLISFIKSDEGFGSDLTKGVDLKVIDKQRSYWTDKYWTDKYWTHK